MKEKRLAKWPNFCRITIILDLMEVAYRLCLDYYTEEYPLIPWTVLP